jgi:hypothetical protein
MAASEPIEHGAIVPAVPFLNGATAKQFSPQLHSPEATTDRYSKR